MSILKNPRWEAFAQAVASGQTSVQAHKSAGMTGTRQSASVLRHHPDIIARVSDILTERNNQHVISLAEATAKLAINRESVMKMLVQDHELAVKANQLGPAVRATELLGKEIGMFIDRQLRKETSDIYEGLSDEQLRELVMERIAKFRVLSAKPLDYDHTTVASIDHEDEAPK